MDRLAKPVIQRSAFLMLFITLSTVHGLEEYGYKSSYTQRNISGDLLIGYDRVQELALSKIATVAIGNYSFP
jgi:hypothetical protein